MWRDVVIPVIGLALVVALVAGVAYVNLMWAEAPLMNAETLGR